MSIVEIRMISDLLLKELLKDSYFRLTECIASLIRLIWSYMTGNFGAVDRVDVKEGFYSGATLNSFVR